MLEINKIYNEDCLEGMKKIDDKSVDFIFTDLPFSTTQNSWDVLIPFEPLWEQYERIIKDDELIVSCKCGCDEGIHFKIHDCGDGEYAFLTYTNGNFYTQQRPFFEKLKKIWAIIRNKDFYYSDIVLTKDDFNEFKEWVNRK